MIINSLESFQKVIKVFMRFERSLPTALFLFPKMQVGFMAMQS